jgi:hypothetical protein
MPLSSSLNRSMPEASVSQDTALMVSCKPSYPAKKRLVFHRAVWRLASLFFTSRIDGNGVPSFQARARMLDTEDLNAAAARRAEAPLATSVLSRSSSSGLHGALRIRFMIRS